MRRMPELTRWGVPLKGSRMHPPRQRGLDERRYAASAAVGDLQKQTVRCRRIFRRNVTPDLAQIRFGAAR
jgi:hypothetical protein